jgi:ribosome-associated protein
MVRLQVDFRSTFLVQSPILRRSMAKTSGDPSVAPPLASALERALAAARIAEETRGTDIRILDLRGVTPMFDYFVVATGTSRRQIHSMADEIEKVMKREWNDLKRGGEGYEEGRWIVLDYGDVVIQLFDAEARDYWDLEHLWSEARRVPQPSAGAAT